MTNQPPPQRQRPQKEPDVQATIAKMRAWATETVAPQLEEVKDGLEKVKAMLTIGLYDPEALAQLVMDIRESERALMDASGALRGMDMALVELHNRKRDLTERLEDVARPIRLEISLAKKDGKNAYPNESTRADELGERLSKNADYQTLKGGLDGVDVDIALKRAEKEDAERTYKTAGKLLYSQRARLENMTARVNYSMTRGENQ